MKKKRILIVEDEAIVAFDLATQLQSRGYEIAGITGYAEEVLPLIRHSDVDLILLDVRLKGSQNGIDLARGLEKLGPYRIIFLTALTDRDVISFIDNNPHFSLVKKPFDPDDLLTEIENVLAVSLTR